MFILGLGAPKSGTTWLDRYISRNSLAQPIAPNGKKEAHFWDRRSATRPLPVVIRRSFDAALGKRLVTPLQYFARIKMLLRQGFQVVTDITPAYSLLSPRELQRIAAGLETHRIDYRVVFIMRDPVARAISKVKQDHFRKLFREYGGAETVPEMLETALANRIFDNQVHYAEALPNIKEAFPEEKTFIAILEELMTPKGVNDLSDFLGWNPDPDYSSVLVGSTPSGPTELSPELLLGLQTYFREDYDYVAEGFPQVKNLWPSFSKGQP